jgi:Tfp pilus assembly protein PilN
MLPIFQVSGGVTGPTLPVVVWTPEAIEVFAPSTKTWTKVSSLNEIKSLVGSKVVLALGRRQSFVRTTRLPDASKEEVSKVLGMQLERLLPTPNQDTAYDFILTDDKNNEGRLVVVAATRAEVLRPLLAEFSDAGLHVDVVVPVATASPLLAAHLGEEDATFIEVTSEGLAIDIVDKGILKNSRIVPVPDSEMELAAEIERTHIAARLPFKKAVACGGLEYGNAAINLAESPAERLASVRPALNLEPPENQLKRDEKKVAKARMVATLAWLFVLGYGLMTYLDYRDATTANERNMKLWKGKITTATQNNKMGESRLTDLKAASNLLDRAFAPKQYLSDIPIVVNSLTPKGVWLTGLTVERGKLATLRGTGISGDVVSTFLTNLSSQKRFRNVTFVRNDSTIGQTNVVNFTVQMHVVGNFPIAIDTKKVRK